MQEQIGLTDQLAVVERKVNLLEMPAMEKMSDPLRLVVQGVHAFGITAKAFDR